MTGKSISGSGALDQMAEALNHPAPAPIMAEPGDIRPERADYDQPPLDPSCPIKPLGIQADMTGSQRCYYLDVNGQLVGLEAGNRHGKLALTALFGTKVEWLEAHFPQLSKPIYEGRGNARTIVREPEIVGFDQAEAATALIVECTRRGIFDPAGKMRGRGAHKLGPDGLIMHYGDKLLAATQRVDGSHKGWRWGDPGLFDGFVYQAGAAIPRPHHEPQGGAPGAKLLELLTTWRWKRRALDPRFLLGWIGAAMIGGALEWRPNIWITGGRGTGKSTLNGEGQVLSQIFGDGLMSTAEASAAAIRQTLRNSTVPVLFDEIEASEDNRRVNEIINLARIASSGATVHRGGQDHQAHEFKIRSCFQFSSINIPALQPQDRSRLGILELLPFQPGDMPPVLADYHLPELGRRLQRRMIDGWPRLSETLHRYQRALSLSGHDNRGCDQFGTLLACADLLLNDELPNDEELAHWAGLCDPRGMSEISETVADQTACLNHLLTSMVQARGGDEREALSIWIFRALEAAGTVHSTLDPEDKTSGRLQNLGLKLVNARWVPGDVDASGKPRGGRWGTTAYRPDQPGFLAVAGAGQGLTPIYGGTKWQGGVWRQSLARTEGSIDQVKVKFGPMSLTAVLVPLCAVLDDSQVPIASQMESFIDWVVSARGDGAVVNGLTR